MAHPAEGRIKHEAIEYSRSRDREARKFSNRDSVLGLREYRHSFRQVLSTRRRNHPGREICRCGRGELAYPSSASNRAPRLLGFAKWRVGRVRGSAAGSPLWNSRGICQSESLSGSAIQAWIDLQSRPRNSPNGSRTPDRISGDCEEPWVYRYFSLDSRWV